MTHIQTFECAGRFLSSCHQSKNTFKAENIIFALKCCDYVRAVNLFYFHYISDKVQCQSNEYTNPVERSNRPDPGVLAVPGGYILVTTSNLSRPGQHPAFPIMFSHNLVNWVPRGHVFPRDGWPVWAQGDAWAPEVHFVTGTGLYHVYYTMRQRFGKPALGVATAADPFGPYTDLGAPLSTRGSCQGVLDATYFKDPV